MESSRISIVVLMFMPNFRKGVGHSLFCHMFRNGKGSIAAREEGGEHPLEEEEKKEGHECLL